MDFKYKNKTITFWTISGEVLGTNKHSETHVYSSGGGGYVGPHGGYVAPAQVNSSITVKHEVWIKRDDGKEVDIKFSNVDIPLREGQKITVVYASIDGNKTGNATLLINHNANQFWYIRFAGDLLSSLDLRKKNGCLPLLGYGLLAYLGLAALVNILPKSDMGVGILAYLICVVIFFMKRNRKAKSVEADLNTHLEKVAHKYF